MKSYLLKFWEGTYLCFFSLSVLCFHILLTNLFKPILLIVCLNCNWEIQKKWVSLLYILTYIRQRTFLLVKVLQLDKHRIHLLLDTTNKLLISSGKKKTQNKTLTSNSAWDSWWSKPPSCRQSTSSQILSGIYQRVHLLFPRSFVPVCLNRADVQSGEIRGSVWCFNLHRHL